MYYFKEEEGMVKKYEVSFDEEQIEKLRIKIINDCSEIIHKNYTAYGVNGPKIYGTFDLRIRNYSKKKVGVQEFNDGPDEDVYEYTYDEYKFPYLVTLIGKLLVGDSEALKSIYTYHEDETQMDYKPTLNDLRAKLDEVLKDTSKSPKEIQAELEQINEKLSKLNQDLIESEKQKGRNEKLNNYCQELISYITLTLVSTMSLEQIKEAEEKQAEVDRFFASDSATLEETSPYLNLHK